MKYLLTDFISIYFGSHCFAISKTWLIRIKKPLKEPCKTTPLFWGCVHRKVGSLGVCLNMGVFCGLASTTTGPWYVNIGFLRCNIGGKNKALYESSKTVWKNRNSTVGPKTTDKNINNHWSDKYHISCMHVTSKNKLLKKLDPSHTISFEQTCDMEK